ncbi:hypothetical protein L1887_61618 [Cichorium endivia]|nr:hypothetical protein L1887_61618 [Cichorium endivia]
MACDKMKRVVGCAAEPGSESDDTPRGRTSYADTAGRVAGISAEAAQRLERLSQLSRHFASPFTRTFPTPFPFTLCSLSFFVSYRRRCSADLCAMLRRCWMTYSKGSGTRHNERRGTGSEPSARVLCRHFHTAGPQSSAERDSSRNSRLAGASHACQSCFPHQKRQRAAAADSNSPRNAPLPRDAGGGGGVANTANCLSTCAAAAGKKKTRLPRDITMACRDIVDPSAESAASIGLAL